VAIVGAGAAMLVDELVQAGYDSLIAVDISAAALEQLAVRLGAATASVSMICADACELRLAVPVDVWHDRATFHFLTEPDRQRAYAARAAAGVRPGGVLILATFAPDGPEMCSGLPVCRHDAASLQWVFEPAFRLFESFRHDHLTPWGTVQHFTYAVFRRSAMGTTVGVDAITR
jgi:SAM-dependent methyltransferase